MKAIVFGGSGFLGQYIVQELLSRKYKVTIFDRSYPKNKYLKNLNFIKGDIQNKEKVVNAIKGKSIVYNFAGISDIGDAMINPIKTSKINLIGTLNILEGCKKYKIKRFIFASTIYVLSRQGGFYKSSKQSIENFIDEYKKKNNLKYTILRYGSVYGPDSDKRNGIKKLIISALKDKSITYGGTARAERRFIHVNDAVKSSVKVLDKKFINKRVLITGNKSIKIKKLISEIKSILRINKKVIFKRKPMMGHYDKNPFNDYPKKQITFFVKPSISLKSGIIKIVDELKK